MSLSNVKSFSSFSKSSGKDEFSMYGLAMFNTNEDVRQISSINFEHWNSMLKISINYGSRSEENNNAVVWSSKYMLKPVIFLTPAKAYLFARDIEKYISDKDKYNGIGVVSGYSVITVFNGSLINDDRNKDFIRVVKMNKDGFVDKDRIYEIKKYNSIKNFEIDDEGKVAFDKYDINDDENVELNLMKIQLDEFVKASTSSYSYYNLKDEQRVIDKQIFTEKGSNY